MKLIFLHGRPAVGKLTVARELARRTGWRLFHNHLAVNLALAISDFGTPGFVALREQVWWAGFRRALADRLPVLIFTFNPENTVPQRFIDELCAEVTAAGGEVTPVELTAPEPEIERRLGSDSRRRDGKLTDLALYRQVREAGAFDRPVLPASRLRLDTTVLTPTEAAAQIAALVRASR
ncbi:MAG: shikimate kinase [Opitutaceae bacterium]|nr:shikimate kinase [Opitutaceae bacterium]